MKKYIIPVAAFILMAGAASAQATPKKTDNTVAKMSKPATKKASTTTTAVSPSTPVPMKKANTDVAGTKKKHHKKNKSVKPVSK